MPLEAEAVPNPDAQRGETAFAPSAADPSVQSEAKEPDPSQAKKPKRKYTMSPRALRRFHRLRRREVSSVVRGPLPEAETLIAGRSEGKG
jgi:hypothetical protein